MLTAGPEEPTALVRLGARGRAEPNTRATMVELHDGLTAESQNRWPSLAFDLGAVNGLLSPFLPAGFYYKTFMAPRGGWKLYEKIIRRAAGLGTPRASPIPTSTRSTMPIATCWWWAAVLRAWPRHWPRRAWARA